jgi:CheY-like chemotaxis protein
MNTDVILHVDDDSNDMLLFQHACRKAGAPFQLHSVPDGHEALAYFRGTGQYADRELHPLPKLVLLDLKMPRVSGFEVLDWMRRQPDFRHLPVVVLTSSNHEHDITRAYDAGANSYLVKPVSFDSLVDMVKCVGQYWLGLNAQASPS